MPIKNVHTHTHTQDHNANKERAHTQMKTDWCSSKISSSSASDLYMSCVFHTEQNNSKKQALEKGAGMREQTCSVEDENILCEQIPHSDMLHKNKRSPFTMQTFGFDDTQLHVSCRDDGAGDGLLFQQTDFCKGVGHPQFSHHHLLRFLLLHMQQTP